MSDLHSPFWRKTKPIGCLLLKHRGSKRFSRRTLNGFFGDRFGNRSIPEYLGDRYQSDGIRILVSIMSLILLFYLIGQLVSGLVMFQLMLGLGKTSALVITTLVLLFYVSLGGAHADIISDGIQGGMMVILAIVVILITGLGVGIENGFVGLMSNLKEQDDLLVHAFNSESTLFS